jgi:hypothetical protein
MAPQSLRRRWSARGSEKDAASVFDVDGVLIDSSERMREAARRAGCRKCPAFWRYFLDPSLIEELDKPRRIGVELALSRMREGYKIIVVTGRPQRLRRITLRQLREIGINPLRLFVKPEGSGMNTWEFKASVIEHLVLAEGIDIAEIHEDDPEALFAMGSKAMGAVLFLHLPGDGYEVVRRPARK